MFIKKFILFLSGKIVPIIIFDLIIVILSYCLIFVLFVQFTVYCFGIRSCIF